MDELNAGKVFVEKGKLLAALYDADAITMDGVRIINQFPSADVAPVRHGRWDENGRCTICGGHAPFWCMASTYYESPYCFECGARMDGDEHGKTEP